MPKEKLRVALLTIQEQISKFDNKASILLTVVGIIFALSLGILDVFNQFPQDIMTPKQQIKYCILIGCSILYFLAFAVEIVFLILVVYPRKKKGGTISINYYLDIASLTDNQIINLLQINDDEELTAYVDQIKVNAEICKLKHRYLTFAIWFLIPLFVSMFTVFLVAIL